MELGLTFPLQRFCKSESAAPRREATAACAGIFM